LNDTTQGWGADLARPAAHAIAFDPSNPRGIVWLASFPRSGNTWTRVFLSNLRRIVDHDMTPFDINRVDTLFGLTDTAVPLYEAELGYSPISAEAGAIIGARTRVLNKLVAGNAGLVMLKTHSANANIQGVRFIPPEVSVGAIYVVRNPLDVVVSAASFMNTSIDQAITDIGTSGLFIPGNNAQVFSLVGSWSENVVTWTAIDNPTLLVVRYEDMIADPAATFAGIADHVLMKYTPGQLSEAIERSAFKALRAQEERSGFREKPGSARDAFFREGRAGQWRDLLTPEQVARVVNDHRDQMARFGYLPQ
jgi:hypothetical protein